MVLAPTKTGTRKLSELARKVVAPTGIVSTGWPAVRDTCNNKLGVYFDEWQDGAGRVILAKRSNGLLAATIGGVGLSVCRQVGKTYLVGATIFALCINMPGLLVVWSAHHARTHGETFLAMQAFADRQKVKPYIKQVFVGSGDEEIRFLNGSRILFGARERGFGRGVPGVDVLVSDEAQIMTDRALDAMLATMNTSRFGLALFIGTPPRPDDPSESFTRMRSDAWSGALEDAVWIEFGADPDSDLDDRKQWAKANPSYPKRTPAESILRLRRKLQADSFRREGLGIWDADMALRFGIPQWAATAQDVRPEGPPVFFITMAKQMASATIAVAALHDGVPHVELAAHQPSTAWVAARVAELSLNHPGAQFAAFAAGPAKAWVPTLAEIGIELKLLTSTEAAAAFAHVKKLAETSSFTHSPDDLVADALAGCEWKEAEGGGTTLDWRKSTGDVSPFAAEAGALWLLESSPAAAFFASWR